MKNSKFWVLGLLLLASTAAGGCDEMKAGNRAQLAEECERLKAKISEKDKLIQQTAADIENMSTQLSSAQDNYNTAKAEASEYKKLYEAEKSRKPEPTTGGNNGETAKGWERGKFGDKITIGSDLLFSSGRATLTNSGKRAIKRIARTIKNDYSGKYVRVYGYTDSDPIRKTRHLWKDNLDLSANRAMAVTRYLIKCGISKKKIETIAMGANHFVASNKSRSGKKKNRRVEIMVIND